MKIMSLCAMYLLAAATCREFVESGGVETVGATVAAAAPATGPAAPIVAIAGGLLSVVGPLVAQFLKGNEKT